MTTIGTICWKLEDWSMELEVIPTISTALNNINLWTTFSKTPWECMTQLPLCTRCCMQGALLQFMAKRHKHDIECKCASCCEVCCFGLYSLCSCPMKTQHINEIWDGEHYEWIWECFQCQKKVVKWTCTHQVFPFSFRILWINLFHLQQAVK